MQSLWLYSDELIMYEDSPLKMIKKNHLVTNEPKTITNFIGLSTSLHAEAKPQFLSETSLFALPTVFGHVWSFKWSNPSTKKNMGHLIWKFPKMGVHPKSSKINFLVLKAMVLGIPHDLKAPDIFDDFSWSRRGSDCVIEQDGEFTLPWPPNIFSL